MTFFIQFNDNFVQFNDIFVKFNDIFVKSNGIFVQFESTEVSPEHAECWVPQDIVETETLKYCHINCPEHGRLIV